jgi:uncharacterized protein (TIGR00290 family)
MKSSTETPKAVLAWSTGKDSAFALLEARRTVQVEIVGLLTTVTQPFDRVTMHGVRTSLLDRQIDALGLPCLKIEIPYPCPNEVYEREMATAMKHLREQGINQVVFGDLFLEDCRAYREARLAEVGMQAYFPLWKRHTATLAMEMIASGLRAIITCVDLKKLPTAFAGRVYDKSLLQDLPLAVDPCGENGEFHTFAWDGPMFRHPIATTPGEIVERDGFAFADLLPVADPVSSPPSYISIFPAHQAESP